MIGISLSLPGVAALNKGVGVIYDNTVIALARVITPQTRFIDRR